MKRIFERSSFKAVFWLTKNAKFTNAIIIAKLMTPNQPYLLRAFYEVDCGNNKFTAVFNPLMPT